MSETICLTREGDKIIVTTLDVSGVARELTATGFECVVRERRVGVIEPVAVWKRGAFHVLRVLFGDEGWFAGWTRKWRGPWRARILATNATFTALERVSCIAWERAQLSSIAWERVHA